MFAARVLFFALLVAFAAAFGPARMSARTSSALNAEWKPLDDPTAKNADGRCLQKDVDKNGKCPGDSGYKPPVGNAPSNFAEYQKALKAAKAAKN
jgi:hypothetical protein